MAKDALASGGPSRQPRGGRPSEEIVEVYGKLFG